MDELPENIPLFPLPGALLLPNSKLPLNIFEPRYINMVEDTIATKHRLIGMIQPVKINTGKEEVHGEFIGMIKLSNRGTEIFKEHFHRLKKIYWNKPFQRAKIFQKAYLTDFIQELVDIGIKVHCVIIESGWKEIDTVEDYKKAIAGFNKKFTKS